MKNVKDSIRPFTEEVQRRQTYEKKYIFDKVSLNKSKQDIINNILRDLNLEINNLAFIGDDLNDISVIRKCFSGCPSDAQNEIKNESDYICIKKGGEGCVREFIDYINDNNL